MKNTLIIKTVTLLTCVTTVQAKELSSSKQPNIVFFLVDDMGWQDTSLPFWKEKTPFNNLYQTPNMVRLAQRGMKFTQAYACSVSSPSRVSLMTGMNAARHRVTNWTLHKDTPVDPPHEILSIPEWNFNGFSQQSDIKHTCRATSLAQLLKDNGYYTVHCGKAHFGAIATLGADPLNLGFDVNIAGHAAGAPASYLGEANFGNNQNGKSSVQAVPGLEKYHGKDIFLTEVLTQEAQAALDKRNKEKPFFLYMSHYAVHSPFDKDARYYEKYASKGMNETEAAYAALVEGMDKSLGDMMDYLDKNNLTDNTIIIFFSDNGGLSSVLRGGEKHTHNKPLSSGKGSAYEGGVRVPMIVSWGREIKPATTCNDYVMVDDFYPTLAAVAGIKKPVIYQKLDGVSILPFLKQKKGVNTKRNLYWNFPNNWGPVGPGIGATCSIRQGDWKLVYYYENGKKELFNIRQDISETNNLAENEYELTQRLSVELSNYLREVDAQRPSFKKTGISVPWPDEVKH